MRVKITIGLQTKRTYTGLCTAEPTGKSARTHLFLDHEDMVDFVNCYYWHWEYNFCTDEFTMRDGNRCLTSKCKKIVDNGKVYHLYPMILDGFADSSIAIKPIKKGRPLKTTSVIISTPNQRGM